MFDRHWVESKASEIPLPDDEPEAMMIVLRIAHLHFKDIPGKAGLSFQTLFNVAVLCDKYDLVHIVRPFVDLHCWAERFFFGAEPSYYPGWLFVAWKFGYAENFEELARHLSMSMTVRNDGKLGAEGHGIQTAEYPPDILGTYPILSSSL
jgi:hypothetical protein